MMSMMIARLASPLLLALAAAVYSALVADSAPSVIGGTSAINGGDSRRAAALRGGRGWRDGAPPVPIWPDAFTAEYVSDWMETHGTFSVSYGGTSLPPRPKVIGGVSAASERIDLADGSRDHLCSAFHNATPCTQLTTGGFRYLHFPAVGRCCRCCSYGGESSAYPCGGPLSPQWLSNATGNLAYEGVEQVRGSPCHRWRLQGIGDNFYYQFVGSGLPCEIDGYNYLRTPEQRADNQYIFDERSIATAVPPSRFAVPDICRSAPFCGPPVCDVGSTNGGGWEAASTGAGGRPL